MSKTTYNMHFCRRCGTPLTNLHDHVFKCQNGHTLYANADPGTGIVLRNAAGEVLMLERAIDPGKGKLDIPGGFCAGAESLEDAIVRELEEEVGLLPKDYTRPEFVMSTIDPYSYEGEELQVLVGVFAAQIIGNPSLKASDDAAKAYFMRPEDVDLEKVQFVTVRAALEWALKHP